MSSVGFVWRVEEGGYEWLWVCVCVCVCVYRVGAFLTKYCKAWLFACGRRAVAGAISIRPYIDGDEWLLRTDTVCFHSPGGCRTKRRLRLRDLCRSAVSTCIATRSAPWQGYPLQAVEVKGEGIMLGITLRQVGISSLASAQRRTLIALM